MEAKNFYVQLLILSLGVGLGLFFLNRIPQLQSHALLSWLSLLVFFILSILMYYLGKRSALSENKNEFTNVVLGFTVAKMFIAILIIFSYIQLTRPEGKLFILPFFAIYLVFTAYETYLMMKLGKTKI